MKQVADNKHIDDYMRGWAGQSYIKIVKYRRAMILNDLYGGQVCFERTKAIKL